MGWIYEQSTGKLYRDGQLVALGYSGKEEAKNQPDLESVRNRGPIPRGAWTILGPPFTHSKLGPVCLRLSPKPGTETWGRSAFLVHGDSVKAPGTASEGCIILPRPVRHALWDSGDRTLLVVPLYLSAAVA